jgi:hypothetical protein
MRASSYRKFTAKPTLSKGPDLLKVACLSYVIANLQLEKVTENECHYEKSTTQFRALRAVWHGAGLTP